VQSVQAKSHAALHESFNHEEKQPLTLRGMDYKIEIGKRIRTAREERGLKLRELAALTDNLVSVSRLNNYEHGARMPGPQEAVLLGKALGKRPAFFLGVDDVQTHISTQEETLIRNWRTLPENERMKLFRQIELASMQHRDPVQDAMVEKHLPVPNRTKAAAAKRVKRG
jgi:transcriptional regulator with XRE-family HTH domain